MRVCFLTGSHPRHAFVARALAQTGTLAGLVIENRENLLPEPPTGIPNHTRSLFIDHFRGREAAEARFFGAAALPDVPAYHVDMTELNTSATVAFVNEQSPDLILTYGVHKLTAETLLGLQAEYKWNIHGGLSPWYRGVITHFWPSFLLEPQMTGMTVHKLTQDIDGGDIIHQSLADLVRGDGVHELACRAVQSLCSDLKQLMELTATGALKGPFKPATTDRIWRSVDWQPGHLHIVYDFYRNRVVDHFLNGDFQHKEPKVVRQF